MSDGTELDEAQDLSAGLARVVHAPTTIEHLEELCRRARQHGGSAFPLAVCCIRLDAADNHLDQLGFSGLATLMQTVHEQARLQLNEGDLTVRFGLAAIGVFLEPRVDNRDRPRDAGAILPAINKSLFEFGDHSIAATVRMAIASMRESQRRAEASLVAVARQARQLSGHGSNRAVFGRATPEKVGGSPRSLLGELTRALHDYNVRGVFQPLLATSGPKIELIRRRAQLGRNVPTIFLNQSVALVEDENFFRWLHDPIDDVEMGFTI